jgi:hypothetical protein
MLNMANLLETSRPRHEAELGKDFVKRTHSQVDHFASMDSLQLSSRASRLKRRSSQQELGGAGSSQNGEAKILTPSFPVTPEHLLTYNFTGKSVVSIFSGYFNPFCFLTSSITSMMTMDSCKLSYLPSFLPSVRAKAASSASQNIP